MRKQYHFQPAASGSGRFDAWDVDRLITISARLPVEQVQVASVSELDTSYWSDGSGTSRTVRQIVEHARLILDVDPSYPVILGSDGRVMDGMHRIARALLEGRPQVPARRFPAPLPPDFIDVRPDELSYER
jgi:hypothetical protein